LVFFFPTLQTISKKQTNLLDRLKQATLVDLETAVLAAVVHCGGNLDDEVKRAISRGRKQSVMDAMDFAVIYLYTLPTVLYIGLNGAFGGYGKDGEEAIPHYLPFGKLLFDALDKQSKLSGMMVWRGIKVSYEQVLGGRGENETITFNQFTSTSRTPAVLCDANFLGDADHGKRTILQIWTTSGVSVETVSDFEEESEIILLPGSTFRIKKITESDYSNDYNVVEVQLEQVSTNTGVSENPAYEMMENYLTPPENTMYAIPMEDTSSNAEPTLLTVTQPMLSNRKGIYGVVADEEV